MTGLRVNKNWPLLVLVVLLVAVGAFAIGYVLADNGEHDATQVPSSDTTQSSVGLSHQSPTVESVQTLRELINRNRFGSFFARTENLLSVLAATDVETLRKFWKQSKSVEASDFREEIQRRIVQRWSVLDPEGVLNLVKSEFVDTYQQDLLKVIFLEWSHANIDEAIRFAHNLDQVHREAAVSSIVLAREDLSITRRREIGRELGCEWMTIEVLSDVINEPVIKEPDLEWASFIRDHREHLDNLDQAQWKLMAYIAYYWISRDGADVLAHMRETVPQHISLLETTEFVVQKLQSTQPQVALELVGELANHALDFGFRELGTHLVRQWAEVEPNKALDATFTVEARSLRRELQKHVLEKFAESDPHLVLDRLDELPFEVRARAHEIALLEIAKDSPESVVGMLTDIADTKVRDRIETAVIEHWARKDVGSLLHWIETDDKFADNREDMKRDALSKLARTDPDLALEVATALPLGSDGKGMEIKVLDWIAITDLDRSIALLHHVRPGDTRVRGYDTAIAMSIMYAHDWGQAIELFLELCELEPSGPYLAFPILVNQVPERLFASLERVSSPTVKKKAARKLLWRWEDENLFSNEQLNSLREIVDPIELTRPRSLSERMRDALDRARNETD